MNDEDLPLYIRLGRRDDLPAVQRIEQGSFSDPWSEQSLADELTSDALRLPLVAESDGQIRGYLMAWRIADQLHVLNIATDPAFLRRGIATALLNTAIRVAHAQGLGEITLEVRRGNRPARAFYDRHGFVEVGVRKGYYADTGEDAVVMTCRLIGPPLADPDETADAGPVPDGDTPDGNPG